jgi:hypothetical protein
MNTKLRKRAKHKGGRPPNDDFGIAKKTISLRIARDLLDDIDAEVKCHKKGRAFEIQSRLADYRETERRVRNDQPTAALVEMVEIIAKLFRGGGKRPAWETDQGEYDGFRFGMNSLLDMVQPGEGFGKLPDYPKQGPASPQGRAWFAIWSELGIERSESLIISARHRKPGPIDPKNKFSKEEGENVVRNAAHEMDMFKRARRLQLGLLGRHSKN